MNYTKCNKFSVPYLSVILLLGFVAISILSAYKLFKVKELSYRILYIPISISWTILVVFVLLVFATKLNAIKVQKIELFKSIVIGTTVFLIQYFIEFIWLLYHKQNYRPAYIQNFSSLSLYQLYHPVDLPSYLIYPMQTINLWEVLYILTIIFVAKKLTKNQIPKLGRTLAIAYCLGLLSWFVMVTFINLLNQPI